MAGLFEIRQENCCWFKCARGYGQGLFVVSSVRRRGYPDSAQPAFSPDIYLARQTSYRLKHFFSNLLYLSWTSTNNSRPKFAKLVQPFSMQWVKKLSGKEVAIYQGYTFYLAGRARSVDHYYCTVRKKCMARFIMDKERNKIKASLLDHHHPPPNFCNGSQNHPERKLQFSKVTRSIGMVEPGSQTTTYAPSGGVTWARNVKGRSVAIVDDYTFYCNKQTASYSVWRCSRSSNCKARFTIRNNTLHRPHLVHEHDRLDYFILDGTIHKAC
uniref:SFRICE_019993 n=1 Tax=Spodoptera frugiperda TaxID=7108 RepID=A0A2H1V9R5_SPOFR